MLSEISQAQKDRPSTVSLTKGPGIVKGRDAAWWAPGAGGECLPGQSLPLEDENIMKDGRDGCTPMCMYLVSLGCTLYMVKYVCVCR